MTERDDHDVILSLLAEGYSIGKAARLLDIAEADVCRAIDIAGWGVLFPGVTGSARGRRHWKVTAIRNLQSCLSKLLSDAQPWPAPTHRSATLSRS